MTSVSSQSVFVVSDLVSDLDAEIARRLIRVAGGGMEPGIEASWPRWPVREISA